MWVYGTVGSGRRSGQKETGEDKNGTKKVKQAQVQNQWSSAQSVDLAHIHTHTHTNARLQTCTLRGVEVEAEEFEGGGWVGWERRE